MEIIRFVLSDFWVWLGAVILILAIGQAAVEIIKAVHPARKISTSRRRQTKAQNATHTSPRTRTG